jgi:RNA polymerase sigma factor (sigma-70 family)
MELFYIRQIIEGDISAFSYFVETYKDMSFAIAYRITNNREDAEEVVQDAFVKAYQSLHRFRQDSKFSTWLFRIVVNLALTKIKKNKRNIVSDIDISMLPDSLIENVETAYKDLDDAEQKKIINIALDGLGTEDRLLLTLYYLNENSIDEISSITGIAADNIKMKLHRARKKMYAGLQHILVSTIKETV